MTQYRCLNPACRALHREKPKVHCPKCLRPGIQGWPVESEELAAPEVKSLKPAPPSGYVTK